MLLKTGCNNLKTYRAEMWYDGQILNANLKLKMTTRGKVKLKKLYHF